MGAHSPPLANQSLEEKPIPCFQNPPDQLTSHKWLHSSPKKWLEVPMMMTPSSNPLMHSKLEAKLIVLDSQNSEPHFTQDFSKFFLLNAPIGHGSQLPFLSSWLPSGHSGRHSLLSMDCGVLVVSPTPHGMHLNFPC